MRREQETLYCSESRVSELLHIKEDFPLGLLTPLTKSLNIRTEEVPVSGVLQVVRSCIQTKIAVLPIRK